MAAVTSSKANKPRKKEEEVPSSREAEGREELRWYSNPWIYQLHVLFINNAVRCSGGHIYLLQTFKWLINSFFVESSSLTHEVVRYLPSNSGNSVVPPLQSIFLARSSPAGGESPVRNIPTPPLCSKLSVKVSSLMSQDSLMAVSLFPCQEAWSYLDQPTEMWR